MCENPVFVKEIKSKFRGRMNPRMLLLLGFLVLAIIVWGHWQAISFVASFPSRGTTAVLWWSAFTILAVIIWIIGPGIAANAISQEREQHTWEMLLCTLLTPREIILGKLAARAMPLVALFVIFLPFLVYCFPSSGLQPSQLLHGLALLICWGFFLSSAGLYTSWASRHSRVATALAYLIAFIPIIGVVAVNSAISIAGNRWVDTPIWWLSPFRAGQALFQLPTDADSASAVLAFHLFVYASIGAVLVAGMILGMRRKVGDGRM